MNHREPKLLRSALGGLAPATPEWLEAVEHVEDGDGNDPVCVPPEPPADPQEQPKGVEGQGGEQSREEAFLTAPIDERGYIDFRIAPPEGIPMPAELDWSVSPETEEAIRRIEENRATALHRIREYGSPVPPDYALVRRTPSPEELERVAKVISGAPFPSKRSLEKARLVWTAITQQGGEG